MKSQRPDLGIGDLIEWQGVPVLLLSDPWETDRGHWRVRACYVRRRKSDYGMSKPWKVIEDFQLSNTPPPYLTFKRRWRGRPPTDRQQSRIMQMLLVGELCERS